MATTNSNIGQAFPLEHLASDIARNNYNYEAILNGLVEWNVTDQDSVKIRLSTQTDPFFHIYEIPSKKVVCDESSVVGRIISPDSAIISNAFAQTSKVNLVLYGGSHIDSGNTNFVPNPDDLGDLVTIRLTVENNGGTTWRIFELPLVVAWVTGQDYRMGNLVSYSDTVYTVSNNLINSIQPPNVDVVNFYFLQNGLVVPPQEIEESNTEFTASKIIRFRLLHDTAGFIIKNVGALASSVSTDITMRITAKAQETPSIYQRSVDVFETSNFINWPGNNPTVEINRDPIWSDDKVYGPTVDQSIRMRQPYSAVMVFNHALQSVCKTVNFINYDGPDLDQGLCIYLPTDVEVGTGISKPEDGFTYEFYFRIWPKPGYTEGVTRDHIINKAQIYVYSSPTIESIFNSQLILENEVIAKFSMARQTSFYTFGENIFISDKPVVIRATFIYSKTQDKWITLDYYQLPDFAFYSPVGFIDPTNPGSSDINNDVIGEISPNAKFVGYESSSFPMFSDVFSKPSLAPFRIDDSEANQFFNRIVN